MNSSKTIVLQIHFPLSTIKDHCDDLTTKVVSACKRYHGRVTEISTKNEADAVVVNINVWAQNAKEFWTNLNTFVHDRIPEILSALIVVCEGARQWDDYLLLYHFKKDQKIDSIPD